jgi:hypothetical protein
MAAPQTSSAEAGEHRVAGVTAEVSDLSAEFPGYEFATQQTWDGIAIVARRHGGCAQPGLYAVVTNDPAEMRRALLEYEGRQP